MERESEMSQIEAARIIRDQGGNCDEPICINCGGDDDCPLLDICGSRGWNQERTLNDIINWLAENDKENVMSDKLGDGHRVCDKCGETIFGSIVHYCKKEMKTQNKIYISGKVSGTDDYIQRFAE